MTVQGEVSYKVKRAILVLRRFTIGQITDITGLDHQSVETVVHRLVDEKTIIPTEDVVRTPSKQGRPRQLYALVEDPTQIQRLRLGVEAFQLGEYSQVVPQRRPDSAHYLHAVSNLDAVEQGALEASPGVFEEIEKHLAFARQHETALEDGIEAPTAYLDFAQARLEFLRGNVAEGEKLLAQARAVFQGFDLSEELRLLNEYAIAVILKKQLTSMSQDSVRAPGILSTQLKEAMESMPHSAISPAISSVISQVAGVADAVMKANAQLVQENQRLQMQVALLVQQNDSLLLLQHASATLDKELRTAHRQPIPNYPSHGFPMPTLKEKQEDLIHGDLMERALAQDYWPEAYTGQKQPRIIRSKSRSH